MLGSLLGYFFYAVATFAGIMVCLIGLFDESTLQRSLHHHPRPQIVQTTEEPHLLVTSGTRVAQNDIKTFRIFDFAEHGLEKFQRKKFSRLKTLSSKSKDDRYSEGMVVRYADKSGYQPGLESQR